MSSSRWLAFGPPLDSLPVVPFKEWMERVRLDAAVALWPTLSWAAKCEEFPVFNQRKAQLARCFEFVRPDTERTMRRGLDRPALHAMLRGLFGGTAPARKRWNSLRTFFALPHRAPVGVAESLGVTVRDPVVGASERTELGQRRGPERETSLECTSEWISARADLARQMPRLIYI